MRRLLLNPLSMLLCGLILGAAARLMDIYCENLGEIFSQLSIWILIGTLIAVYSPSRKAAALNILPFCLGMLLTYYAVAILTHGVYGRRFIVGWTAFAFFSPMLAYFTWQAKEPGKLAVFIRIGIILVSVTANFLMFGVPRVYDLIINAALIYVLFFKNIKRSK